MQLLLLLLAASIRAESAIDGDGKRSGTAPDSALDMVRQLRVPAPSATTNGEYEGAAFWEMHDSLLRHAWLEYDRAHPGLFTFNASFEERYIHPQMRAAVQSLRRAAATGSSTTEQLERTLLRESGGLFEELAPGVWGTRRLFSVAFGTDMDEELRHQAASGIPMRRPNGMNRYGAILGDVGFESALAGLVSAYLRPLAEALFPAHVGGDDAAEHFAFAIRYRGGEDVALAEHRDAAVATINVCLHTSSSFTGGDLEFVLEEGEGGHTPEGRERKKKARMKWEPGLAILHLGKLRHAALPLRAGERTNLVVWLHGRHGVVRVAPYAAHEQLSGNKRWIRHSGSSGGARGEL